MVLFIIGLVFILVSIFLLALTIGKGMGLKWASKINFTTNVKEAEDVVNDINNNYKKAVSYEKEENGTFLFPLFWFFFCVGIMLFVPSFELLRERYVKQYCDGKYEWEQSAYVNERGEVRPVGTKMLVRVKDFENRKTLYLQRDTTLTE